MRITPSQRCSDPLSDEDIQGEPYRVVRDSDILERHRRALYEDERSRLIEDIRRRERERDRLAAQPRMAEE